MTAYRQNADLVSDDCMIILLTGSEHRGDNPASLMRHPDPASDEPAIASRSSVAPTDSGFGIPVEREARLSDKVADSILRTILSRQLKPGAALPSERELGEQYDVSRTVIREAVRALGAQGVVDARAGRGLRVARVGHEKVSTSLALYLHGQEELPYPKIHQVRNAIELAIAALAAEQTTDEQIETMRELCRQMRAAATSAEEHSRLDVEFHRELARSTGNELFLIVLDSIGDVMLQVRRISFALPGDPAKADREHTAILRAVAAHDPERAREAMRKHLEHAVRDWTKLGPVHVPQ